MGIFFTFFSASVYCFLCKSTFSLKHALNQADRIIFVPKYYLNMLRPDFSDMQKNGFRIYQFRLIHSLKGEYVGDNLIEERDRIIIYLIQRNEICYTISYFALRLTFLLIIATALTLLSKGTKFPLTLILAMLSIILFIIARKYREYFILGDVGIKFAESIYNARISEVYNF
jgi:hypothetical protein